MKEVNITVLSDREHLLKLPQMYIGSMTKTITEELILKKSRLVKEQVEFVPALIKIINEAIDNSLDEATKTDFKFGNKISISITNTKVKIEDNGRGIPVKKAQGSETLMPVLAFCNARAGSNFDKEDSSSIGTHGIGIKATNIFSTQFKAETSDGENKLTLNCIKNMAEISFSTKPCKQYYTKIEFIPDLARFGLEKIDNYHKKIIEQRILFLSMSYPKIKFSFNGEKVAIANNKEFMDLFSDKYELFSGKDWFVGVYPNEEEDFSFFSYVNGLHLTRGGNHIEAISMEFSYKLRDILIKRFKTIKPGDIKNKISIVVFFNNFKNMSFDSQTKETLTNPIPEIKEFMKLTTEDFIVMAKKLSKNKDIIDPIIEMFKIKEEYKKRQALKGLSNNKKKIVSENYFAPIGKKKYLFLTEGFSATSSMLKILGRKNIAYYSLKGKPLNTYGVLTSRLIKNLEFKNIVDILNIDLLNPKTDMEYEKVIFLSDADSDGIHIRSLLLTFFNRFTPKMIDDGRIGFMNTPLLVGFDSKNKPKKWFFNLDDYNLDLKKNFKSYKTLKMKYYKGLGSFNKSDLQEIIDNVGGMENLFTLFQRNELSGKSLKEWMSISESDSRKTFLKNRAFNVSSV